MGSRSFDLGAGVYKLEHGWATIAGFACASDDDRACTVQTYVQSKERVLRVRIEGIHTCFCLLRDLADVGFRIVNLMLVP